MKSDRWFGMAAAAKLAGVTGADAVRKFRRRMQALNKDHGGRLLRATGSGKKRPRLEVSAEALAHYSRVDVKREESEVTQLRFDIAEIRESVRALKMTVKQLRKRIVALETTDSKTPPDAAKGAPP